MPSQPVCDCNWLLFYHSFSHMLRRLFFTRIAMLPYDIIQMQMQQRTPSWKKTLSEWCVLLGWVTTRFCMCFLFALHKSNFFVLIFSAHPHVKWFGFEFTVKRVGFGWDEIVWYVGECKYGNEKTLWHFHENCSEINYNQTELKTYAM